MYPDLSYLLHQIFNTPFDNSFSVIKTYGSIVVINTVICAYLLKNEILLREKGRIIPLIKERQIAIYVIILINLCIFTIIGYCFNSILSTISSNTSFTFYLQDKQKISASIGFLFGALVSYFQYRKFVKQGIHYFTLSSRVYNLVAFIMLGAAIFSKFLGLLEIKSLYELNINILQKIDNYGTNYYGGLIGGLIFGFLYFKFYKIPIHWLFDSIAPILMLGYSIGRLACHFSGDGDWGVASTALKPIWVPSFLWQCYYPNNVLNQGEPMINIVCKYFHILKQPVYPTSLYESIVSLTFFIVLWKFRKIMHKPYTASCFFLLLLSFERFIVEFIRVNPKSEIFGIYLSQAQIISLLLFLFSIIFLLKDDEKSFKSC